MEIAPILKQATAKKKAEGYPAAIDFLIESYPQIEKNDLGSLLDKIYTYFYRDIENVKVKDFISGLIKSRTIDKYSGLLSDYYWMLEDYESFKLTIMKQISEVNPYHPWQYCYNLKGLQLLLCQYFAKMGVEKEDNALEYLYNLISSIYLDVGAELMTYDNNIARLPTHINYGYEYTFYQPSRLIPLGESINDYFDKDSIESECLKTLKSSVTANQIRKELREKIFYDFPKKLGFKNDILSKKVPDGKTFALTFFSEGDLRDILVLTDKIQTWKIDIAGKTVGLASDEANNILSYIYGKNK